MSGCCSRKEKEETRRACPQDHKTYSNIPYQTLLYHIAEPWRIGLKEQTYYFCANPDCDVVYFGEDNSTIGKHQLRTRVGIKETDEEALICYCFGVSKAAARSDKKAKEFVMEQTKKSACACSTHNPSGRCCLKDFPK